MENFDIISTRIISYLPELEGLTIHSKIATRKEDKGLRMRLGYCRREPIDNTGKRRDRKGYSIQYNIAINVKEIKKRYRRDPWFCQTFRDFLDSIAEFNETTAILVVFLHELGHVHLMNTFAKKNRFPKYKFVSQSVETIYSTVFTGKDVLELQKEGVDVSKIFDSVESFSDSFALRKFPIIWRRLQKENLV